ncbi:MAG: hypothetical protein IT306_31090 [Chloroflexi bacterium]|nr:hypothetical protein [Chloroflexota bacterium]
MLRLILLGLSAVLAILVVVSAGILRSPRAAQSTVSVAAASPNSINATFPLGVFEDAQMIGGRGGRFEAMLTDLQARGLDSVLLTNSYASRDASLLDVSDRLGMNVFFALTDLQQPWWADDAPADRARAEALVRPAIERLAGHPSLKGYSIADEPTLDLKDKLAVLTDVFHTLDPERPAMPILIGLDRAQPLYQAAKPRVLLIDVYPFGFKNPVGDLSMTGYGYWFMDFISYVRAVSQQREPGTPLWMILQTHSFKEELRQPIPAELRVQNWLAVGEGATGIFWFVYSSQQGWTGLKDNPGLMTEVANFATQIRPVRESLVRSVKADDAFQVSGDNSAYVSTLQRDDGRKLAVVVNRDVLRAHEVAITSKIGGRLRSLTGNDCRSYELGQPIPFEAGSGAVFELVEDGQTAAGAYEGGVPPYPVDYTAEVTKWWAGHPLNPDSLCHISEDAIVSPPNVVNVARQYGGNIQTAIDALPGNGGTLYFEPGSYSAAFKLVGKSNVHFVSDGGAILKGGPAQISGCTVGLDYGPFNTAFARKDPDALRCATTERIQNIYFKNLTFDGEGTALQAISLSAARDVLFDNITLQNYADPKEHHRGLISATAMLDNIWVRGSHFVGNERYALYFDGAQGSGVIGSTIEPGFGSGGLLFLTNDDFSLDLNGNDQWDPGEMRHSNYIVVANNTFNADANGRSLYSIVSYTGANALITGNQVKGGVQMLADFANRCSQRWANLPYEHIGSKVIGNRVRNARQLVNVSGQTINCAGADGTIGRYEVKDNVIEISTGLEAVVQERGKVVGPNVTSANWTLGVSGGGR